MHYRLRIFLASSMSLSVGVSAVAAPEAGAAVEDITPPAGWRMSGYFRKRVNTGRHDPLWAKAVVIKQGETSAALVVCDLIGVPSSVTGPARRLASERTGIPVSNIAVTATHTHTAPLYYGALREYWHSQSTREQNQDPHEPIDYSAKLVEAIARVIERAQAAVRPVRIEVGEVTQDPPLSFNRRYHMKDGSVRFNPGQKNPSIVRAAGPIDPEVGILMFRDADGGGPFAGLTVFALHPDTTGGTEWSADYPYWLEQTLRGRFGNDFVSVFGLGTCGDVNDIDVSVDKRRGAKVIGTMLGKTVLATAAELRPLDGVGLAVRHTTVAAPLQRYSAERVRQARKDMAKIGTPQLAFLKAVETYKIADLQLRREPAIPLEVQAIRLNKDVAMVMLPGEVFVELGLAIKRASPFRTTLVIELANDNPAYIPTMQAFEEGSYETVNSRIQPGGGEKMVEAAIDLLKTLMESPS